MSTIPTISTIIEAVAEHFRVPVARILSPRRDIATARPRQIAMWIARTHANRELTVIGRAFDRDHTTVLSAVRRIERLIVEDREFAAKVWECVQAVDCVTSVDRRRAALRIVA